MRFLPGNFFRMGEQSLANPLIVAAFSMACGLPSCLGPHDEGCMSLCPLTED